MRCIPHVATNLRYRVTTRSISCLYNSNLEIRLFSSDTRNKNEAKEESSSPPPTLLYKASSSKATFPRGLLAFTTVHASYWSWYVLDFTPALQASAADPASIDPTVGYLGLGLSIFMSIGSFLYPKSLISEISRKDNGNEGLAHVQIKTFSLPFVLPSSITEYKLGDIVIDSPGDVTKILTDYNGDMSRFPGHMALHAQGTYTNLLMNMDEKSNKGEIVDNDLLLQTLKPGQVHSLPKNANAGKRLGNANAGVDSTSMQTLKVKRKKKNRFHQKSK